MRLIQAQAPSFGLGTVARRYADGRPSGARSKSSAPCYVDRVKRLALALAIGYVVLALVGRGKEAAGVYTCECYPDCWCKKPGLSLFRWVFPRFHLSPVRDEWQKRQLDA